MNIEEKAKAYDEALERCKQWASGTWGHSVDDSPKDIAEFIFPSLAESEDERIGKCISMALTDVEERLKDCLAYLEKQKEQKHPNGCFTCDEYKKGYEEGRRNGFTAGYNKAMKEVEQKEQKPVECELEDAFKNYTDAGITVSCGDIVAKPKEQKPAEKQDFVSQLKEYLANTPKEQIKAEWEELKKWDNVDPTAEEYLSRVKPILSLAKKELDKPTEWSEEDEDMLNSCISSIEEAKESRYAYKETDGDTSYDHEIAWLKSLPERFNIQPKPECDNETEIQKAYREGKNAGRKEVFDHPEEYGLQLRRMYDYETGRKNPEWGDEDKHRLQQAINALDRNGYYVLVDWLKSLPERFGFQPKQAWSEEDDGELQNAIDALEFLGKKGVYKSESGYDAALQAASWLKNLSLSLKKRNEDVTKLCSNEWSEEDEEIFNNIIEKAKGGHWIEVNEITWLITRFKSLRPQPKQEWDTHDKAIVNCIVCCLDGQFVSESARKKSLEWFNKHRRDFLNSPHWKPSEEQMRELLKVVDKARELHYTSIDGYDGYNALRSLYEQLKHLRG